MVALARLQEPGRSRADRPFQERTFSASNVVAVCQTFTFTGFLFVMSLFLQQVQHYSPSLTGVALLPAFGCALLATSFSGRLMARIGAKSVMVIGLILSAAGCLEMVMIEDHTSYMLLACLLAVLGGGLALVLPAMTEAAIAHAPQAQSGIASGMLNVSRQVGGVIGVAILGALVDNPQTFLSAVPVPVPATFYICEYASPVLRNWTRRFSFMEARICGSAAQRYKLAFQALAFARC